MNWERGLDVVVVNYKTPDDLEEFLRSFDMWNDRLPPTYLWIVNVENDPESDRVARNYMRFGRNATYLSHPMNVGFAQAVNDAAARGQREMIAIFNADTILTPGLLEDCWARLNWDEEHGILGPRQVDERGRITHAGIFGTLEKPQHRGWLRPNSKEYADTQTAVSVSGSAYFIKRTVWDELTECPIYQEIAPKAEGAFLPTPHYYEETWCSYHAQAHGHKVLYFGGAEMVHKWHKASPVGGEADRFMPESRELFRNACDRHNIPHD